MNIGSRAFPARSLSLIPALSVSFPPAPSLSDPFFYYPGVLASFFVPSLDSLL